MALTEASLQTQIQAHGYGTDTASAQSEALKAVWRRVLGMRRWPFLETTQSLTAIASNSTVSLAPITDLGRLDAVRLSIGTTENYDLTYQAPQDLRAQLRTNTDAATPAYWTKYAGALLLYPKPDRAYTVVVDYLQVPTYSTSALNFPEIHQDVLVWGAIARLAFRQRDANGQATANAEYREALQEMIRAYGIEQHQNSLEVGHSDIWDSVRA